MHEKNKLKSPFKVHCFVCTKCENGQVLRDQLKELVKKELPGAPVRINQSGCLDSCEHPIACVIYPQSMFFLDQDQKNAPFLLEEIKKSLAQTLE